MKMLTAATTGAFPSEMVQETDGLVSHFGAICSVRRNDLAELCGGMLPMNGNVFVVFRRISDLAFGARRSLETNLFGIALVIHGFFNVVPVSDASSSFAVILVRRGEESFISNVDDGLDSRWEFDARIVKVLEQIVQEPRQTHNVIPVCIFARGSRLA